MGQITIHWPDADAERVEAAKGRLDVARRRLAARGEEDLLAALAEVVDLWCDPGSRWRRRLTEMHPAASGFSPEVVEAGMRLALEDWSGETFRRTVAAEIAGLRRAGERRLVPFASTSIVLAGAIPMPSLLQPLLSLASRSPVLVRPASRDPVTPRLLAESVAEVDPELGRAIEVVSFPATDTGSLDRFLAAECVVASGSDETIAALAARTRPSQRVVAYGHRLSIAVVAADAVASGAASLAGSASLDVALWDQLGCLSPVAVYVTGDAPFEAARALADTLATALGDRAAALPRGEVDAATAAAIAHERDGAAVRAADDERVAVHAGEGTTWTVIAEADARWRPSPLHRFVRVHPVTRDEGLDHALRPIARHLSSIALADGGDEELAAVVATLPASRICAPGRLQAPPLDWPHDGRPLLAPLVRLQSDERPGGTGTPAADRPRGAS